MVGTRVRSVVLWSFVLFAAFGSDRALATIKYGPFQISGNLQAQNIIRHPDIEHYQFIQQRNTARVRFEYAWLQKGMLMDKYRIPFVERSDLYIYYRGVYDSIYDYTPGFIQKEDVYRDSYPGGLNLFEYANLKGNNSGKPGFARRQMTVAGMTHETRDALKFDNQLREAYVDLKMRGIPLTVRAGRQQIVWGESDNFRMLDRVNTLDVTWHFAQELFWDEIRRPFWMLKFLYDLKNIGPLSQSFLEWYWNPGDWRPVKVAFMPRPWGVPLLDPLTNRVDGAFYGGFCELSPFKVQGNGPNAGAGKCLSLMKGTKLFNKGDYERNPMENSQTGVRYHGVTPQGFEFTLNYLYQRWAGDDGTPSAPIKSLPDTLGYRNAASRLLSRGIFPAEYYVPYIHTAGVAGNYSDEEYTQTVFRLESVYDMGIPFFDVSKVTIVDSPTLPGVTKKEMWKGMLAFDRPTWIRMLNKKSTFFITGQFFWHHIIDMKNCEAQSIARAGTRAKEAQGECLIGPLDLPSVARVGNSNNAPAYRDKIRAWESIFSIAAFTFYRGGSLWPFVALVVDPINDFTMEVIPRFEYVVRDDLTFTVTQRYFINPKGHNSPRHDPWGFSSLSNGRSETQLNLTFQF
jgi:hypothetical protein